VFKGSALNPSLLAAEAMNFVHEFNDANPRRGRRPVQDALAIQQTSTTFSGLVDASCGTGGPTSWGLIMRNQRGETCVSKCIREDIDVEPMLAKALGVR